MSPHPTVIDSIQRARALLESRGIPNARLNVEWMLGKVLGLDRLQLYIQYERPLQPGEVAEFDALLQRRIAREPLQYILGGWRFRELELKVDRRALIPRPETELTAELAIEAARRLPAPLVADIGTGSGCIALSVAREVPGSRVWATDISEEALELARANAAALGLEVAFLKGDLYEALPRDLAGRLDVIVSNPPYVAEEEYPSLQPEVLQYEPPQALRAGTGGTEFLVRLLERSGDWLAPGGSLILEGAPGHLPALAEAWGAGLVADLAGLPRCLVLTP